MANAHLFRRHAAAETAMLDAVMPQTPEAHIELPARRPVVRPRIVITVANNGGARLVRLAPAVTLSPTEVR